MIRFRYLFSPVVLFLLVFRSLFAVELPSTINQVSDGSTTTISLKTYNKSNEEDQAFTRLVTIDKSANFKIEAVDIPPEVVFVIVQIHTYLYNVSMSYPDNLVNKERGRFVTGRNIGLLVETNLVKTAAVNVMNENDFEVEGLIAVVAYGRSDPLPGGCNMEFEVEVSPFQKLTFDNATITVDAQPASIPKISTVLPLCERFSPHHEAYRMYMLEQDFSNETYFKAIANMLTVKDIQQNAELIPQSLYGSTMRRVYSLYPGTGSVYGMIAYFANHSSAYVPIVTYGCDPSSLSDSCTMLTTSFAKVLCALSFFLGILVATRGHYYFKISMFLVGMMLGGYVGYTMGSVVETFSTEGTIMAAIVFGIFMSLIWLLLWLTLSSPLPSLILSSLTLGSFFFCVFYFTIPAGSLYLEIDAYFWLLFASFIIMSFMIFSLMPLVSNILCFTLVGAYVTVFSVDYYSGSYLKFLVINGIRRATVPNFNVAVVDPPYQDKDIMLTFFWAFIVIIGLYKQCASSWNRAPFPPSSTNTVISYGETAPLLGGRRYQIQSRPFYNGPRNQQRVDF